MDSTEILARFAQFAGLTSETAAQWSALCAAAGARVAELLRPDAPPDDPRLTLAAAGEAYYQYALLQGGAESFRVGDISVTGGSGGGGGARALRDTLLAGAAGLLDCGFAGIRQVAD